MTNEEVTQALQHLIGTQYTDSVKAQITQATGRDRVVGPNEVSTRNYDLMRVHVQADKQGVITGFAFN